MKKARISSLAGRLCNDIENSKDKMQTYRRQLSGRHYQEFAANLLDNEKERQEDICKEFEKKLFPADEDQETNFAQMVHERLEENEQISDKTFSKAIYTSYFSEVFHEQINSIFVPDRSAEIELTIKEKKIGLTFENNECIEEQRDIIISNSSLYIDDPFVLDEMNYNSLFGISELPIHKKHILQKLMQREEQHTVPIFWKLWSYIRKSIKQVRDAIIIWQIFRKKAPFLKMSQAI